MTTPILVVEDDDDSRVMLATLLTLRGYTVVTAANGAEALTVARLFPPRLILLDLMMPVMDGEEFRAQQLADPELCQIPVVLVSARHGANEKAAQMRISRCVQKPIQCDELVAIVRAELSGGPPDS